MRRILAILLVVFLLLGAASTVSAAEEKVRAYAYTGGDRAEPQGVLVDSVEELLHYLDEYHDRKQPFDITEYDAKFFKNNVLLFTLLQATGSSPKFEIASVTETATTITIEATKPDEPTTPDIVSWILRVELPRDRTDREILVNSVKISPTPYADSMHHNTFAHGNCSVCGAKGPVEFIDVPADAWYAEAVAAASAAGLMQGVGQEQFAPEATVTRAMVVTVLWRKAGSETAPETATPVFSDVSEGWYSDAVAWANAKGIAKGYPLPQTDAATGCSAYFAPDQPVTREELATFLYRDAVANGRDTTKRAALTEFSDRNAVSDWASEAMQWCVAEGILNGTTQNATRLLMPQAPATRAELAATLTRLIKTTE